MKEIHIEQTTEQKIQLDKVFDEYQRINKHGIHKILLINSKTAKYCGQITTRRSASNWSLTVTLRLFPVNEKIYGSFHMLQKMGGVGYNRLNDGIERILEHGREIISALGYTYPNEEDAKKDLSNYWKEFFKANGVNVIEMD